MACNLTTNVIKSMHMHNHNGGRFSVAYSHVQAVARCFSASNVSLNYLIGPLIFATSFSRYAAVYSKTFEEKNTFVARIEKGVFTEKTFL